MFKVGDKVRFLNDVGEGKVIAIHSSSKVEVLSSDGFEYTYSTLDIVPFGDVSDYSGSAYAATEEVVREEVKEIQKTSEPAPVRQKVSEQFLEVDLHIQELISNTKGLSNGDMIEIQVHHFREQLEWAIKQRIKKIVFIHGVGQGILKQEIRHRLKGYTNLEYHDASYARYGYGATEVLIR